MDVDGKLLPDALMTTSMVLVKKRLPLTIPLNLAGAPRTASLYTRRLDSAPRSAAESDRTCVMDGGIPISLVMSVSCCRLCNNSTQPVYQY